MENNTRQTNQRQRTKPAVEVKFMNVGNALKVTCVGFAVGVLLRAVQMLYFFDYDTGFYTDGGIMAACCLLFTVGAAVLGGAMCFCSRKYFGPYLPRKNNMLGAVAALSGVALIASAAMQTADFLNFRKTGISAYESSSRGAIHIAFTIACFLFGIVQIIAAVGFFRGHGLLEKAPLLYLFGVAWGIAYLIMVYVFYAKSSSFVENFFAVFGGACTLLCLFYMCKLFAWVDEEDAAKRVFITGIAAVVLTVTYSLANLALLLLGKSYSGEIPAMIQLSSLGVSLFILMFLMTFKKYSIRRTPRGSTMEFQAIKLEKEINGEMVEKSAKKTL